MEVVKLGLHPATALSVYSKTAVLFPQTGQTDLFSASLPEGFTSDGLSWLKCAWTSPAAEAGGLGKSSSVNGAGRFNSPVHGAHH
ncbi:MAG: hypothetical protein OT477_06735 [Chloroflexi bacterium]|nr:hypothetical protein [Chloroflexota bacterium]